MTTETLDNQENESSPRIFVDVSVPVRGDAGKVSEVIYAFNASLERAAGDAIFEIKGADPTLHASLASELRNIGIPSAPTLGPLIRRQQLTGSVPA
jgi:hypothetical protein